MQARPIGHTSDDELADGDGENAGVDARNSGVGSGAFTGSDGLNDRGFQRFRSFQRHWKN